MEPDRVDPSGKPVRAKRARWMLRGLIAAAVAGAAVYLSPHLAYYLSHESTDDAYVTGTIVPISPEVKGKVTRVYIQDNQQVREGDLLFEVQEDDYAARAEESEKGLAALLAEDKQIEALLQEQKQALAKAVADLESNRAQEAYALKEKTRYADLLGAKDISQNQYDQVAAKWDVAHAATVWAPASSFTA